MGKKIKHLEMAGICKSFHGVHANQDIHLKISSGEILGLLGENGAGKTTLMNILYGLYQPDDGEIRINGDPVKITSPLESIRLGIGMVHQHFMLVQNHSVIENIALGYQGAPYFFPRKGLKKKIETFSQAFGFSIDPDKRVWQLSAGEQQRVEIIKVLLNGADLLILDEPTSVLTPQEIKALSDTLRQMKAQGHMVIFISHKLDEIMDICDRVQVLAKGKTSGSALTRDTDKTGLARMMVGRDVVFNLDRETLGKGNQVLSVDRIIVRSDKGQKAINGISFDLYQNEIVGIAGVAGNGQRELAEAVTGIRPVESGDIRIDKESVTNKSPRFIFDRGISHVPEERIRFGIAPGLFLHDNAILKQHHLDKFSSRFFLKYSQIREHTALLMDDFNISTHSMNTPIKNLSGGNIQKLILGREISEPPRLLVASHPTYGLDVGATQFIREQLLKLRRQGSAVLLFSEDLEEIFELCDRIAVIFDGRLMALLDAGDPRLRDIGLMMAGACQITDSEPVETGFAGEVHP